MRHIIPLLAPRLCRGDKRGQMNQPTLLITGAAEFSIGSHAAEAFLAGGSNRRRR